MEMDWASRRINELYASIEDEANTREARMAVGLILLWPSRSWLEGGGGTVVPPTLDLPQVALADTDLLRKRLILDFPVLPPG